MIKTENRRIACQRFPDVTVQKKTVGGFATAAQVSDLVGLDVLFGNEKYDSGDRVFLEGETAFQPWAKKIRKLNGVEFILIPEEFVILSCKRSDLPKE